jgi:hypothetical protein
LLNLNGCFLVLRLGMTGLVPHDPAIVNPLNTAHIGRQMWLDPGPLLCQGAKVNEF